MILIYIHNYHKIQIVPTGSRARNAFFEKPRLRFKKKKKWLKKFCSAVLAALAALNPT